MAGPAIQNLKTNAGPGGAQSELLPAGTYYYTVRFADGARHTGTITLLR